MVSEFTRANRTRLNVFPKGDIYRFRMYFDEPGLFASLQPYYNKQEYRFEVPGDRFENVADLLRSYGYNPVVVEDVEPFVVAFKRFRDHPRVLFKNAIDERRTGRYTLFLLRDQESVRKAVEKGARQVRDLEGVSWPARKGD